MALSLDSKMQYLAYREIKLAVEQHHAKAGSIVVLDAKSGEVLALANWPSYNPNNRAKVELKAMRNHAVTDLFEPGSTMKPFTVATALEAGKVTPQTVINTENGVFTVGGRKIHDTHPEASLTVSRIIQLSSNVGAAKMALSMTPETFWRGLSEVGFGAQTGSAFPGEASGKLRDYQKWQPIEQANIAFGNGISVNLLQLARAYTVFANDGELKSVTLLRQDTPTVGKKVFSQTTVQASARHAGTGGTARRHRAAGADQRLPRGGQDRHRAQGGRGTLRQPICRLVCRSGSGIQPAPDRGGDGGRTER